MASYVTCKVNAVASASGQERRTKYAFSILAEEGPVVLTLGFETEEAAEEAKGQLEAALGHATEVSVPL